MPSARFLVRKDRLGAAEWQAVPEAPLSDGQVRVRIDLAALTANNITYAAFGQAMHYWDFYPADDGWGCIPVWGFGEVVESRRDGAPAGARLYGYWPMATHAVLTPERVSAQGFTEAAAHRRALPAAYNRYLFTHADPFHRPETEAVQALLRPLHGTSWLIDDFLSDSGFFGADTVLVSSASSKTGYGTAWELSRRAGIRRIGLTSPRHMAFCRSLGCYHEVWAYDELDRLAADTACVYVDFAGSAPLRQRVHEHFSQLRYSCSVGGTHVDELGGAKGLPGPRPTLFFAPARMEKRRADWGSAEFGQRMAQAWHAFAARVAEGNPPWLHVAEHHGQAAVADAYQNMLAGRGDARAGHVLRPAI